MAKKPAEYIPGAATLDGIKGKDNYGAFCTFVDGFSQYIFKPSTDPKSKDPEYKRMLRLYAMEGARFLQDPNQTSIGQRAKIEEEGLKDWLNGSTLEEILKSDFGKDLDSKTKKAIKDKYGSKKYGAIVKKITDFEGEVEKLHGHYNPLIQAAVDAKKDDEAQKLNKEYQNKIKKLKETYKADELNDLKDDIDRIQKALYATRTRDAVLSMRHVRGLSQSKLVEKANE